MPDVSVDVTAFLEFEICVALQIQKYMLLSTLWYRHKVQCHSFFELKYPVNQNKSFIGTGTSNQCICEMY